jgi:hypothetical protein
MIGPTQSLVRRARDSLRQEIAFATHMAWISREAIMDGWRQFPTQESSHLHLTVYVK